MNRLLLVLLMFGWAGCTQQEDVKFDPTKHEITAIDTVGVHWGWGFKGMDTTLYRDYATYPWRAWGAFDFDPKDSNRVLFIDPIHGMTAIYEIDTTFALLRLPLFTTGELKKIKELLND